MEQRLLGGSGLHVPVIGMGTWRTFDVTDDKQVDQRREVVDAALASDLTLFDTSPMYGAAPTTLSKALRGRRERAIIADKVWTADDEAADRQMRRAFELFDNRVDIYQVHNLVAWEKRLRSLEQWRDQGRVTSIGITHYQHSAFVDMMRIMRSGRVTMVQVPYNAVDRVVEQELLPLAAELHIGVLVMRPLGQGTLAAKSPPAAALECLAPFGVQTWAQALLKWVLSDPTITAVLPATTSVEHAQQNAAAGDPPWFGPAERAYIADLAQRA